MLNVNEKCLDITPNDIVPDEEFPVSIHSKDITCFVPISSNFYNFDDYINDNV